ncbi:MAG: metallophosphoesterase [Candidatus Heimdallarchaeota archaeon]
MRILLLSDIHGNLTALSTVVKHIKTQGLNINLVLIAGDMPITTPISLMLEFMIKHPSKVLSKTEYTKWVYKGKGRSKFLSKQKQSINRILRLLGTLKIPIVYIPGNVDCIEVRETILQHSEAETYFLDCAKLVLNDIEFIGVGGSELDSSRSTTPLCDREYHPIEYKDRINPLLSSRRDSDSLDAKNTRILITHEPPAFKVQEGAKVDQGGSSTVTELINLFKPDIAVFGHYHEIPLVKKTRKCIYVNPGPAARYNYALLDLSGGKPGVTIDRLSPLRRDIINFVYSISSYRRYAGVPAESVIFK